MAKDKLATLVWNRFSFAKTQQEELFDDFQRYRTLWRSKISSPTDYPWDYALFNPMVYATVRSFVSRIATGNVGVNLQAWTQAERPKTRINKSLLEWEFQEAELFLKVARWVFSTLLYGRSFVGTGWKFEKERVIQEEDEQGNVGRELLIAPKVNRADLENVRVYDMFIGNRNITDLQKQPWVVRRMYRTIPELEAENRARGNKVYRNLEELKKKDWFVNFVDYGADVQSAEDTLPKKDRWKSGVLEILSMWDKERDQVVEIVAGHEDFTIREEENPFYHGLYPLADLIFFPEDDEFWSPGAVMPIEDLQIALNSTLNQYLTNANQQLNNMWITSDARIPEWEFISRPNGVIHVNGDVDQLKEVTHKDITTQAEAMMGRIETQIQRTTGITDQLSMGSVPRGTRGAAYLQLEQQNLDDNLKLFLTLLEQGGIKQVARQFLALNTQFITTEQTIKITGRHGYSHTDIKPDDVSAAFDPIIIPESSLPKNPLIRVQNLTQIKQMADTDQRVKVNTVPIWKEILDTMGMTDLDEIVPDDMDEALEENELLKKNVPVECQPNDNHDLHIKIHQYEVIAGQLDPETTSRFIEHIKTHKTWKLAADPELLEKMAANEQPTPNNNVDGIPSPLDATQSAQPQLLGIPVPVAGNGDPAATTAPVDELGLIQQQAQLGAAPASDQPPVIDPLLATGGVI